MLDLLHWCLNCSPGLQPRAGPLQAISRRTAAQKTTAAPQNVSTKCNEAVV